MSWTVPRWAWNDTGAMNVVEDMKILEGIVLPYLRNCWKHAEMNWKQGCEEVYEQIIENEGINMYNTEGRRICE